MSRAKAQHGWLRSWCAAIALVATCAPSVLAQSDGLIAAGTMIELPPQDPRAAWQTVVDVVDDFYPIERNNPPNRVEGIWRAGRLQTFALAVPAPPAIQAPEYRRWVGVMLQRTATATRVEVSAFIEVRDILHGVDPEAAAWRPQGHDVAEEQRIAALLAAQLGGRAQVFEPLPEEPLAAGRLANYPRVERLAGNVLSDAANFYSCPSLATMGVAFGIGAALANTDADKDIRQAYFSGIGYQDGIHAFKYFGEGLYTLPAYAAIGLVGTAFENTQVGGVLQEYGVRGLRTALVGGPPMLLMQLVTGGGRPGEHPWGSRWVPFFDDNGVSGHAFIGAIPFVTAAKMTERPVLKVIFYGLSVMPALSRLNDSAHYPSQIFLGYTMSVVAATAVDHTQRGETAPIIVPFAIGNTTGMGALFRF